MPVSALHLSEHLAPLVKRKYLAAEAEKALLFSETQLAVIRVAEIPVNCPLDKANIGVLRRKKLN